MGFQIVGAPEQIETVWCNVVKGDTVYVGQIVRVNNEGVSPLLVANGVGDRVNHLIGAGFTGTANNVPFGIVIGTNAQTPAFDTTQKAEEMVELAARSSTVDTYFGVEGPLGVNGQRDSMVEVAVIYPHTRIRGQINNAALGTAISEVALSGTPTSTAATSAAADVATVANLSTIYFRTGACAGQYRILDTASDTTHEWDAETIGTAVSGDKVVVCNGLRTFGNSIAYIDTEAMYIDSSAALTASYHALNVLKLDLSTAGREYVEFNFALTSFLTADHIV